MSSTDLAPIVLFVYNRPSHTLKVLEALSTNPLAKDSILYIYADGAKENVNKKVLKDIKTTREILKQKKWCGTVNIIESKKNKGLAVSIVEGVTNIINKYEKVIVLEDDIITSPFFLQYMNQALDLYLDEEKVMHISAFTPYTTGAEKLPETYFLRFMSCWGWATWKRSWDRLIIDNEYFYKTLPLRPDFKVYNLDGTNIMFDQIVRNHNKTLKTWAVKWYSSIFINNGLCLFPHYSLIKNIGFDGTGENCDNSTIRYDIITTRPILVQPINIESNQYAYSYLKRFNKYGNNSSFIRRCYVLLKKHAISFLKKIK